ncbi:hypothetical protein [Thiomicrorhabdus xiamenensis]|uniref:Uncharacterized protein n=1 Tax=Thiomicrorhabdus xiamenensis TaxID=2739063 RepID=A0A7D4SIF0_9GAMM|nr:hypothetical protein [Thiomicrorhabdus xiamenensis]QKI88539.1 hypothetical protein HQN79_02590 [Thiomicrorhabdus xiamenensis]
MAIVTQQQIDTKEVTEFYCAHFKKDGQIFRSPYFTTRKELENWRANFNGKTTQCGKYTTF